jgi:hypothetical protein
LTAADEQMIEGSDGEMHPISDVAVDTDRAPGDPELVAGAFKPDPWDEHPERWEDTEPWPF